MSGPPKSTLDILKLQWDTASANLQFVARHYEINSPASAGDIYAFGMIRHHNGYGGFIAGAPPLNMLFSTRERGLAASGPLPVTILSLSPDGNLAQIQTDDAGVGLARVDWRSLRLHGPEPMKNLGHKTFPWSPDSRFMIIGTQSQQGSYVRMYDVKLRRIVSSEALRTDTHELPLGLWFWADPPSEVPRAESRQRDTGHSIPASNM